jgi:DNA polymerase
VTDSGPQPGHIARYLRQQREFAGPEIFLDTLSKEEMFELISSWQRSPAIDLTSPESRVGGVAPQSSGSPEYEGLRAEALSCTSCELAKTRIQVVFSDGNPNARLMVVGEAPGAKEDQTGKAFVGPAGKFLDLLLASVGLHRETSAYICNVLKCRPPGNRNPLPREIEACTTFLKRQIEVISPQALLAVGAFSAQFLTGREAPIGQLRGEVYSYHGVPLVVTYHPAALLRNGTLTRPTWDDLQLLRQVMDGT